MPLIWAPNKFCRSNRDLCRDCTEPLQDGREHNWEDLCLYCKESRKSRDKKICGQYTIEATIPNKIRLDKCDVYTAKETLGYRGRKTYVTAVRRAAKRKGTKEEQEEKQTHE